jgi:MFS transporter, DHA3 family, macrolide efflux protein
LTNETPVGSKKKGGSHFRSLLAQRRGFLPLFTGDVVSFSGFAIFTAAIQWFVYTTTGSALDVAYAGLAFFLPTIFIGIFAGALVDRVNKRRLMIACDLARAAAVTIIPVYTFLAGFNLWVIVVVTLAVGAFSTLFRPAARAIMPLLVSVESIQDANGLMSASESLANTISLAAGGLLIAAIGASTTLFYNSATYVVSAVMIFLILMPSAKSNSVSPAKEGTIQEQNVADPSHGTSFLSEIREGLRFMRDHMGILEITLISTVLNFFFGMSLNFAAVYATAFLHADATIYGLILAAFSFGNAIGSLIVGRINALRHAGRVLIIASLGFGFATLGLIVLRNYVFASAMSFSLGFALGICITLYFSIVQTLVPPNLLGRVISVDEVGSFAALPLAQVFGGVVIQIYGIVPDFEIAGIGLIACGIVSIFLKDMRNLKVRPWETPSQNQKQTVLPCGK